MRRAWWVSVVVVLGSVSLGLVARGADPLPTVFLGCQTVWGNDPGEGSFRLGNNLDCPDDGIQITKSGITVDLGGHRLTGPDLPGDGTDVGVLVGPEVDGVTIRNGVIAGYNRGVLLSDASDSKVQNLTMVDTDIESIRALNGSRNEISGNTIILGSSDNDGRVEVETTTTGGNNIVANNTLVGVAIAVEDSGGNTVSGNRIYGAPDDGLLVSGEAEANRVESNTVIGSVNSGIEVIGEEADDNVVVGNTVRASGFGIKIEGGDRNKVLDNTATANGEGIEVVAGADQTRIDGNTASANRTFGINVVTGSLEVRITDNKVNENGSVGIFSAFGNAPVISDNVVNFNGYFQGANDNNLDGAIDATGATGSGNKARGNDVNGADQCEPDLCDDGPADPPPLTACGITISDARTIRNPLVCDSNTHALRLQGSGYTVNLGSHVLTGGNATSNEAAMVIASGASDLKIVGGVLMDSEHGILTPSVGAPAVRVSVNGATILRNDNEGFLIQGLDPTPADAVAESGRHTVKSSTIFANGAAGIIAFQAPFNTFRSNLLMDNGSSGVDMSQSRGNVVEGNRVIGNGAGIEMSNDGDANLLPIGQTITGNTVIGSENSGIVGTNSSGGSFIDNVVRGNGTTGNAGMLLSGTSLVGAGFNENLVRGNTVTASSGNGISVVSQASGNRVKSNKVSSNDGDGIFIGNDADDTRITRNATNENGADAADGAGIVVSDPIDGDEVADVVSDNKALRNGFLATTTDPNTGDGDGLGILFGSDSDGTGNVAKGNDDIRQCDPDNRC